MWPWPNCKCGKISMSRTRKRPIEYLCFDCGDREDAKRLATIVFKGDAPFSEGLTHRHRKGLPCVRCENLRFH
jgi:hypothetical protein